MSKVDFSKCPYCNLEVTETIYNSSYTKRLCSECHYEISYNEYNMGYGSNCQIRIGYNYWGCNFNYITKLFEVLEVLHKNYGITAGEYKTITTDQESLMDCIELVFKIIKNIDLE